MTYQVTTASKQPGFPHAPLSVRRRFRDFVVRAPPGPAAAVWLPPGRLARQMCDE